MDTTSHSGSGSPDSMSRAFAEALSGLSSRVEYLDCLVLLLSRLIPADTVGLNRVDLSTGAVEIYGTPAELYQDSHLPPELLAQLTDHPMVRSYVGGATDRRPDYAPRRMSDIISRHDLHATRTYSELLEPLGMETQLTIVIERPTAISASCWTFTRARRDFSDDDRDLATRIQPLLVSLARAEAQLFSPGPDSTELKQNVFGLTRREIDVLGHLARGLTAAAIGTCLGVAQGTVRKHLEHAYSKLGTHDRLTAVDRVRQAGLIPPATAQV